jgi:3-phosphoshikimate 1-carboxyvinyltransferase
VDTYNHHPKAMSQALVGLRVPGVVVRNPGCVAKTYPGFWQDLEKLRQA